MLEQAAALLRAAPSSAWNYYVAGAAPLLVAIIYGVAQASVHALSADQIGTAAVVLTVLFLWMSWTKIHFAQALGSQLAVAPEHAHASWSATVIQGTKLIIVPLSALAIFPYAGSVAFYGNMAALAGRPDAFRESTRSARLWPRQNWTALGFLAGFALVVFLNVAILIGMLPVLARMFTGYENAFTRNPAAMLNWTFAAAVFGVTWFLIDPLVLAMYVVRCFKGESIGSGADLRAALRRLAVGFAVICCMITAAHARPVSGSELDAKIRHTLQSPAYSWQNPDPPAGDTPRWIAHIANLGHTIGHWFRVAIDWVGARLRELLGSGDHPVASGSAPPQTSLRWAIYAALLVIAVLAFLLVRKALAASQAPAPALTLSGAIDLKGDVLASELPEDEWLRLAREALERGDLRLALRAAYLANLAWLGSAGFVAISRFKSNRDYEREVRLRSRSDAITALLKSNREVFESAWYGDADKTPEDVADMQSNLVKMRELAHA